MNNITKIKRDTHAEGNYAGNQTLRLIFFSLILRLYCYLPKYYYYEVFKLHIAGWAQGG